MTWPNILVSVVTCLYIGSTIGYFISGNVSQGLIFSGYSLANIGILLLNK